MKQLSALFMFSEQERGLREGLVGKTVEQAIPL
jgi:hypothetical protein